MSGIGKTDLSREAMLDLMAYADGELEGAERARIEELVRKSEEARRVVDSLRTLGDVVRTLPESEAVSQRLLDGIADGIADDVMRSLEAEPAVPVSNVVPLAARRAGGRGRAVGVAVGVLALAAGALLMLRTSGPAPGPVATETPHETAPML
jgi:anti-sigma factor RsiW